jgi:mono/diheme cytochrome c family protein
MNVTMRTASGFVLALLMTGATSASRPRAQALPGSAAKPSVADAVRPRAFGGTDARALLNEYCVGCHNARLKTANLSLDRADVTAIGADAETWEKVLLKLRTGAMPPVGRPHPDASSAGAMGAWLETQLDRAAVAHPNPGAVPAHRLNRAEYTNVIRDLLALDIDAKALLPADDAGYGFDNIADVLSVSPGLLERYLVAAQTVSRLAIGDPTIRPAVQPYKQLELLRQEDRVSEDLPFGTRGGVVAHHTFPLDGEYDIKVTLQKAVEGERVRGVQERNVLELYLDGRLLKEFTIFCPERQRGGGGGEGGTQDACAQAADANLSMRVPVKAGPHIVGAAFQRNFVIGEGLQPDRTPVVSMAYAFGQQIQTAVDSILIGGPFDVAGAGASPSRQRIFVCRPSEPKDEEHCAKTILAALARRAYRKPVTDADVQPLLTFYESGRRERDFESGIQFALEALLVSPDFLFRSERARAESGPATAVRVSDVELASRLSFFLWSSMPDEELLDVAARGQLRTPAVLARQVKRMLTNPRADAMVSNFGGQWLLLRSLPEAAIDPHEYPDFDDNLREAFRRETELLLASQVREDRPVGELLRSDYTFVNERLAEFYGIPHVYGSHFRRVQITNPQRFGLLGQASILTATSYGNRTSPVLRGKWVLENILGAPPPPPPPNVPALDDTPAGSVPKTMRERMSQHRANPVCASCHARIDPLGFALENFDAIGHWRGSEGGHVLDVSGALPDGTAFNGPAELRTLLQRHQSEFVTTAVIKLLTYALGRGVEYYDMPAVRQILHDAAPHDYAWSSIIEGIVKSVPFQMRRAES